MGCARCLGGQTPAPTRAATRKDLAAVLGSHAGAESVIALSLEHARLKCTLHGGYLSVFVSFCRCIAAGWLLGTLSEPGSFKGRGL